VDVKFSGEVIHTDDAAHGVSTLKSAYSLRLSTVSLSLVQ
jgi:hypothetical protein